MSYGPMTIRDGEMLTPWGCTFTAWGDTEMSWGPTLIACTGARVQSQSCSCCAGFREQALSCPKIHQEYHIDSDSLAGADMKAVAQDQNTSRTPGAVHDEGGVTEQHISSLAEDKHASHTLSSRWRCRQLILSCTQSLHKTWEAGEKLTVGSTAMPTGLTGMRQGEMDMPVAPN